VSFKKAKNSAAIPITAKFSEALITVFYTLQHAFHSLDNSGQHP